LLTGVVERQDVIRASFAGPAGVETMLSCTNVGIGVTAHLSALAESPWGRRLLGLGPLGFPPAVVLGVAALSVRAADVPVCLRLDGQEIRTTLQNANLMVVRDMGPLRRYIPGQTRCSGVLHVSLIGGATAGQALQIVAGAARSGRHADHPCVDSLSTDPATNRWGLSGVRRLELEAEQPLPVHLMGEVVGATPAVFEVLPSALRVVGPERAALERH